MFNDDEDYGFLTGGFGDLDGDGRVDFAEYLNEEYEYQQIMGNKDNDDDFSISDDDDDWDDDDDDDWDIDDDDDDDVTTTTTTSAAAGNSLTSIGDSQTGVVAVTQGAWYDWVEANGGWPSEVVSAKQAYNMSTGSIITLIAYDTTATPDSMAQASMQKLYDDNCTGVTGAHVTIGGYSALQTYGKYPDGTFLVTWFFDGDDGYVHYIAVEFTEDDYASFSMVENNYSLDR